MFSIKYLKLTSLSNQEYIYSFSEGLNYLVGKNDSGKTEFYFFIDYMFGKDEKHIAQKEWYANTLKKGEIEFQYNSLSYIAIRELQTGYNYFFYRDEEDNVSLSLDEYKEKLNAIFSQKKDLLKQLRDFTEQDISFRTFTLFNFLGENRLGVLNDFFDKCSEMKYSIKLPLILDFIFNRNIRTIFQLKEEIDELKKWINQLEGAQKSNEYSKNRINQQLKILGVNAIFDESNFEYIYSELRRIKEMNLEVSFGTKARAVSELEAIYNSLTEQIKVIENEISDAIEIEKENKNRKKLIDTFNSLLSEHNEYDYLLEPILSLSNDLDKSISFSKYVISDNTVRELRKKQQIIKDEIDANQYRFEFYSVEAKTKALLIIEEHLESYDKTVDKDEIVALRKALNEKRKTLLALQQSDDVDVINALATRITQLYLSASDVSNIVQANKVLNGFIIRYYKRGNLLQPQINQDASNTENYYTGSMARHTLIQLCGYLGFLELLLSDNRYPIIPFLVIDHISKPFDVENRKALGEILREFYQHVEKKNLQIIMFDDEKFADLGIIPDHHENLVSGEKSGFNPFYFKME